MKESVERDDWSKVDDGTTRGDGSKKMSPLYLTIYNVYKRNVATDPDHEFHGDLKGWQKFCLRIWKRQKMVCKISKGRMDLERGPTQPSLDAKKASDRHVRGNLQFVCVFLQYGQRHEAIKKTFKEHNEYCKYLGVAPRI